MNLLINKVWLSFSGEEDSAVDATISVSEEFKGRVPAQDVPFSTCHLIWVNYEVLSQLSQPMPLLFSYLNSVQHNSVIELCREQIVFGLVPEENNLNFFRYFFCFFQYCTFSLLFLLRAHNFMAH